MIESKKIKNPFPGLRPFETDEYRLFFGREGQSDALIARLQRSRFLAVVGTSGSGKSSLVRAGLLPALRGGMMAGAGGGWRIAIMRPGSDPIGNLAIALAEKEVLLQAGAGLPPAEAEAVIEATLRSSSLGLVDAARQARLEEHEKLLVVVDQFEELFRFRAARAPSSTGDDAAAFVKLLLEASLKPELSIYVVPTMRSDFLGDCAQFQGLPEAINEGQYLIPRMTRDERRFAITGPVGVTRGKITEPLINRLMNDVGDNPDQLPILQHALMRTWDYWAAHRRDGEPLGLEHYEEIGTMSDALSEHADEAYNALPEKGQVIAEVMFRSLTERGADNREIRRPSRLKEICEISGASAPEVIAVIDVFRDRGNSFLMPPAGVALNPESVIDISHESLIRNWRRLHAWVKDESESARIYRRFCEAMMDYKAGARGLLDDVELQYVLKWRERANPDRAWGVRYHPEFDAAMGYLEESRVARDERVKAEQERDRRELETARAFAEKQARSARRLRWAAVAMAVLFVFALGGAGYAQYLRADARESERKARESEGKARESEGKAIAAKIEAERLKKVAEEEKEKADVLRGVAAKSAADLKTTNEGLETAKKNLEGALAAAEKAKTDAREQQAKAERLKDEAVATVKRGELVRKGVQAFRRAKFPDALGFLEELRADLAPRQPGANTAGVAMPVQVRQYQEDYGWTLTNIGATHQKTALQKPVTFDETETFQRMAAFEQAKQYYEKALTVLGKVLPKESDDPLLLDTQDGLAHSYLELAKYGRPGPGGVLDKNHLQQDFEKAEVFFRLALAFREKHRPSEAASGYLELARVYRDDGKFDKAEATFQRVIELRKKSNATGVFSINERIAIAATQKELAELYQLYGQQNDALRVLTEMVILQEDVTVDDIAKHGQEIANGYSDLGQVYSDMAGEARPKEEVARLKRMADNADRTAYILQRAGVKFRRAKNYHGSRKAPEWLNIAKDLAADLDQLGDAYDEMGKSSDAEAIYQTSYEYREGTPDEWKSHLKLRAFYLEQKEYGQAEYYNNLLIDVYKANPRSEKYIDALVLLAGVHAGKPSKYSEAEEVYNRALDIATAQDDWQYPDLILYSLGQLHLKQKKTKERGIAIMRRLEILSSFFKRLPDPGRRPRAPINLVSAYINAVEAAAFFQINVLKNNVEAETAYQPLSTAYEYITGSVFNIKVLENYALALDHYHVLLENMTKPDDAKRVKDLSKVLKTRLEKLLQSAESSRQQPTQVQAPTQPGAATQTQ